MRRVARLCVATCSKERQCDAWLREASYGVAGQCHAKRRHAMRGNGNV